MTKKLKGLGKYVDFKTDFGMKLYFGREENKSILIDFLNDLFEGEKIIQELEYAPTEYDGDIEGERRLTYDLHCTGIDGECFIIEMQLLSQAFFMNQAVFYTSRLISRQAKKGKEGEDCELPEVYFIALTDFDISHRQGILGQYFYDVKFWDIISEKPIYNKLGYKFMVLTNFVKKESELISHMDQWLYLLKHMSDMQKVPAFLDKPIFSLIFSIGEVAKLKKEDLMEYEASLKRKMDERSIFGGARREGREIGRKEVSLEAAKKLILQYEFKDEEIADVSGLTLNEVQKVRKDLKKAPEVNENDPCYA